jgi:O-antigen/teichoic acid export membrane protein
VLVLSAVFLLISLFVREANFILTSQSFHSAYLVAYWVTLAQLTQGLYYIPVNFLFLRKKTQYVPFVTLASAIVDVSLNLLLIPRYGMIAAAWSGFASKIVMVIVVSLIANKVYPIPYEYVRIGKLLSVVLALFATSLLIPSGSLWVSLAEKSALFVSFPLFLYCLQFFTPDEKHGIISTLKNLGFSKGKPLL